MINCWFQMCASALAADFETLGGVLNRTGKFQWFITTDTRQILKAALLEGDHARAAFHAWQSVTDLDNLPFDQYELLPVVYQNLARQYIDHPWLGRLRGIYRKTWYQHQTGYGAVLKLGAAFADKGIQPVVFDGETPAEQSAISQPRSVISLVVPRKHACYALKTAAQMGYHPLQASTRVDKDDFFIWNSGTLLQADQGIKIRLRWHFLDDWLSDDLDEWIVSRAVSSTHSGEKLLSLDPTASFFIMCASGTCSLTKLVDACLIVRQHDNIDWPWLELAAQKADMVNPVPGVMGILRNILGDCIPDRIPHEFFPDDRVYSGENKDGTWTMAIKQHREKFRRLAAAQKMKPTLSAFCGYLKHTWGKDSIWGVIGHGVVRASALLTRSNAP